MLPKCDAKMWLCKFTDFDTILMCARVGMGTRDELEIPVAESFEAERCGQSRKDCVA